MSRKLQVLISFLVIIVVLFGTSLFIVSSKINPTELKKYITHVVQENFVDVETKIKEINYSVGTSINIEINGFHLISKLDRSQLLNMEKIIIRAPLASVLTSGSIVDIKALSPKVFIRSHNGANNWQSAINSKSKNGSSEKIIQIPSFISRSKLNYRFENIHLMLDAGKEKRTKHIIDKILIKNAQLEKSTAFEIKSKIKLTLTAEKELSSNLQVIGEMYLIDFIEKNSFNASTSLKLTQNKVKGVVKEIPDVKGKLKFEGGIESFKGLINLDFKNHLFLEATISKKNHHLNLTKFLVNMKNERISSFLTGRSAKFFEPIDWNKSETEVEGQLDIDLKTFSVKPQLVYGLNRSIAVQTLGMKLDLEGEWDNKELKLNGEGDFLKGDIEVESKIKFKDLYLNKAIEQEGMVVISLEGEGQKIDPTVVRKKLWMSKNDQEQAASELESKSLPFLNYKSHFSFKNINLNNKPLSLTIDFDQINGYLTGKAQVRNEKGKMALDFKKEAHVITGKGSLKEFDAALFENLLVRNSHLNITGLYNGSFSFNYSKASFDFKVDLKSNNSQLSAFKLQQQLIEEIQKTNIPKPNEKIEIFDKESSFSHVRISKKGNKVKLPKVTLANKKRKESFSFKGEALLTQDNKWIMTGKINSKWLRKNLGQKKQGHPIIFSLSDEELDLNVESLRADWKLNDRSN